MRLHCLHCPSGDAHMPTQNPCAHASMSGQRVMRFSASSRRSSGPHRARNLPLPPGGRARRCARTPVSRKTRTDSSCEKTTPAASGSGPMCPMRGRRTDGSFIAAGQGLAVAAGQGRPRGSTSQAKALLVQKVKVLQTAPASRNGYGDAHIPEKVKLDLHPRYLVMQLHMITFKRLNGYGDAHGI